MQLLGSPLTKNKSCVVSTFLYINRIIQKFQQRLYALNRRVKYNPRS